MIGLILTFKYCTQPSYNVDESCHLIAFVMRIQSLYVKDMYSKYATGVQDAGPFPMLSEVIGLFFCV